MAPPLHSGPRFDHADLVSGEGKKLKKIGCSSSLLHVAVTHVDLTAPRGACACVPACAPPPRHPVWCRADAHNGYLCEFQVYQGREEGVQDSLGTRVVLPLSNSLEGKSYHLYFDNFFTSVSLLSTLLSKGLYACGTTRQSYKEFPPALKMKGKGKAEMQQHGLVNR